MQPSKQPILILTCQHDSHYFEERTIVLSEVVKVGRAVARSKAAPNNAIFDCKVLSRNHAIIWFKSDEFWLRDTNSSNGTFVNNTRITKRDENDSCDRQIFSGDVIRFGVDVVDNEITHGCIIASVTLFLPNGNEAKAKHEQSCSETVLAGHVPINAEQIFQLTCFLNDSIYREQALENKLESLRQALQEAELASEIGWKAMLNEERLLDKLDLYEKQARAFKENIPEDALKSKLDDLMRERAMQESKLKAELADILNEKYSALQRVRELERSMFSLQEECIYLRENYASSQHAYNNLCTEFKSNIAEISQRLTDSNVDRNQVEEEIAKKIEENNILQQKVDQLFKELTQNRELREGDKHSIVNGVPHVGKSERENEATSTCNENEMEVHACSELDHMLDGAISAKLTEPLVASHISGDEFSLKNQSESSVPLSDCIKNFHLSLNLLRALKEKVNPIHTMNVSPISKPDVETRSLTSLMLVLQEVLQHHETAITNLHAYLQQVNPLSASELHKVMHSDGKLFTGTPNNERFLSSDANTKITDNPARLNHCTDKLLESIEFSDLLKVKEVVESSNSDITEEISSNGPWFPQLPNNNQSSVEKSLTSSDVVRQETSNERVLMEMHTKLNYFEEQLRQTQETHQLLLEDTRYRQAEMQSLREERDRLETMLVASQLQVELLQASPPPPFSDKPLSTRDSLVDSGADITSSTVDGNDSSSFTENKEESETFELMPQRLVTAYNLIVVPFILIVFSAMFVIFSKFIS